MIRRAAAAIRTANAVNLFPVPDVPPFPDGVLKPAEDIEAAIQLDEEPFGAFPIETFGVLAEDFRGQMEKGQV